MKPHKSEGLSNKWNPFYVNMPTIDTILSQPENKIYVAEKFMTIQHFPEKLTWIVTSWSKFCSIKSGASS